MITLYNDDCLNQLSIELFGNIIDKIENEFRNKNNGL